MKGAFRAVYYGIRSKLDASRYEYDPGQFSGWEGMQHNAGVWRELMKSGRRRMERDMRIKKFKVPSIHIRIFNIYL